MGFETIKGFNTYAGKFENGSIVANLCSSTEAGYFYDGGAVTTWLGDSSFIGGRAVRTTNSLGGNECWLSTDTYAGYFTKDTRYLHILDTNYVINAEGLANFTNGAVRATLANTATMQAGEFVDGTNTVLLAANTVALSVVGNTGFSVGDNIFASGNVVIGNNTYSSLGQLEVDMGTKNAACYFADSISTPTKIATMIDTANTAVASFSDNGVGIASIMNGTASFYTNANAGESAFYGYDTGGNTLYLCDGTYAVNATVGSIKGAFTSSGGNAGANSGGAIPVYNDGVTSGQLSSITIEDGIITAYTTLP